MRSAPRTVKIPVPLIDTVEYLRRPGHPFTDYPSTNAALVGLLRYAIAFPRPHELTAGIARLPAADQDQIDDLIAKAVRAGVDLREYLPKPATVEALLALARNPPANLQ
jgi:hypothetical protein